MPGQSPYNETRRVVLRGADGIVFVVDSRWSQLPKNLESLQNLRQNLKEEGIDAATIPFAVQFNKRDLPDVLAVDALQEGLGLAGHPFIEAVASEGKGVVETFKLISKLTFVDILRRLQKRGAPKPARPAASETENLSAWKSSMVHGMSAHAPEVPPPAARRVPEPIAFPEADDLGTTRAIPTLASPHPAAVAASDPDSPPIAVAPFPMEEEGSGTAEEAPAETARRDAIVFETFPPLAEPSGVTEDTNPAFFPRRPASAPAPVEFPGQDDRASTAAFALPAVPDLPEPPEAPAAPFAPGEPAAAAAAEAARPESAEAPPPVMAEAARPAAEATSVAPETSPPAAEPAPVASAFEERMIQLAVVSAWGDRISAAEQKLARWDELEQRLSGVENGLAQGAGIPARIGALEGRLGQVEAARGWAKDFDLLRTDWTNARLASEGQVSDLRRGISDLQQSLAEGSGREMELVAQVSRESLATAAALEKLGFRIQETEEKFSQLVVDQESRLARLERLVDELSARSTAERESARQAVLELEERFRAFRDEETESRRRTAAEIDETVRQARDDFARRQSSADDLRRRLADALADLAGRLGDPHTPS